MNLGDRIKEYEKISSFRLVKKIPLIIRVDGKAFHTFTRKYASRENPFDKDFISAMALSAKNVAEKLQGFKAAYVQSDEVTFWLSDYDSIETQPWFDYKLSKVVSISASLMTAYFNICFPNKGVPVFDSRAFSVPKEEIINTFLWRSMDWKRNSLQMYARHFFSHQELHKKVQNEIHEMLYKIGKNWTIELSPQERNGTFLFKSSEGIVARADILPSYQSICSGFSTYFNDPVFINGAIDD